MELDLAPIALADICEDAERAFRPVAEQNELDFTIELDPDLPSAIVSDDQRLKQILKNLLSNAFKFTHEGGVTLSIGHARDDREFSFDALRRRRARDLVRGHRHWRRDRRRQARRDLRGLPAGRRHDVAEVRRHRARAIDLPRDRAAARRRDPRRVRSSATGSTFCSVPADRPSGRSRRGRATAPGRAARDAATSERRRRRRRGAEFDDDRDRLEPDDRVVLLIDSGRRTRAERCWRRSGRAGARRSSPRRPTAGLALAREYRPRRGRAGRRPTSRRGACSVS